MTQTNLLKAKMAFLNLTIASVSKALGLSYLQTHKKIHNKAQFTQRELKILWQLLKLTEKEFLEIFFNKAS